MEKVTKVISTSHRKTKIKAKKTEIDSAEDPPSLFYPIQKLFLYVQRKTWLRLRQHTYLCRQVRQCGDYTHLKRDPGGKVCMSQKKKRDVNSLFLMGILDLERENPKIPLDNK